ncbi:MAG: EAL domain-containing protein [Burkholderiaceae bacterium]|nr:EAL domain-containing protein [Burkholderiaceae bacterium]
MSAGGVDALLPLLEALPPGLGLCCVLLQHLPAGHASMLAEILARRLGRPVRDLEDGDLPEADALWVAPSGRQPVFDGTRLRLIDTADTLQPCPSIDRFFSDLAQQLGPRAAGVILSGTGGDGAQGLRRIRLAGGLALVQSPDSARYVGMPEAAIRACDPQHVAPPPELARVLHGWPRRLAGRDFDVPADESPADEAIDAALQPQPAAEALRALAVPLRQRCGIDIGHFKDSLLQRQLQRRCRARRCTDLPEYLARIEADPSELDALAAALLVPVTAFWRDAAAFETLLAQCRERLAGHDEDEPLRAWVAGCATGEEAYSVAIVLLEALGERRGRRALQVFATDLDTDALMQARRGRFAAAAMPDLPAELAERWFECKGRHWEARPALRECLSFSRHDLTRDPPFARLDLVSCRHLLMYLRPASQEAVLRQLAYALRPGGLLLLGRHEAVRGHAAQFHRIGGTVELFERSQVPLALPRDGGAGAGGEPQACAGTGMTRPATPRRSAPRPDWRDLLLRQAAERYLPPSVLLGEQLEILQVQGDVTPFFALQGGLHRPHLLALARPGVAEVLRSLFARPAAQRERHRPTLTTLVGRHQGRWRVEWQPCPGEEAAPLSLLAFLRLGTRGQPVGARGDAEPGGAGAAPAGGEAAAPNALHVELEIAHERLQRLGRQFEAAQHQARESSADAAAALAELQARFDALEARHEELQTANQELATVNAQLRLQAQTQQMQARDLLSIYQSIALPVLASDEQHAIHAYNAAAAQLLHLSPGSAGLPLSALRLPSGLPDLTACAEHALQSANPVLLELPPLDGGREFLVHAVRRAVEGEPRGAVLTFVERGLLPAAPQAAGLARPGRRIESNWWAAMSRSSALLAVKDLSGRYLFASAAYAAFFGLAVQTLVGRTDMQCLPLATARELRRRDLQALQDEPQARLEDLPGEGEGGARRWCCTRTVIRDRQGVSLAIAVQALDIGAQLQREQADHAAAGIFEVIGEGIALTDAAQKVARVNAAFTRLTGYDGETLGGRSPLALAVPDRQGNGPPRDLIERLDPSADRSGDRREAHPGEAGDAWQGEVWLRRRDGRDFPAWVTVSPVRGADGRTGHFVHTVSDISRLYETRESLRHLATHEPLTGLPNRALLIDRLGHALETARRRGSEVALCFIDLDHFKTINDSLGHDAGDEVIRLAADRIAENVRSADTLARLGGDEFVLLIENTNRHDCLQSVERISRAMAETYLLRGNLLSTTASIGIAMYPGDGGDSATLMRHADAAMYRAKRAGRGRCEFFSAEVGDSARARLQLESGLRRALELREFCLHYQPQVEVRSGRVVGLEALLRWQPPQGEAVSPTIFLPVAEETALIGHIGDWVLAEACAQLARWRDAGQALPRLSVNVSARQLRDRQFAERLQQLLVGHALPGKYLMLEITESALLQPNEGVLQVLQRLHAMGVKLSLDDFGTGYSSLASLRQLPLEELKIDRSFVQGALEQRDDREIVEAIIGLGRALGLHVVAEGVETAGLWDYFRRQDDGVSLQGFHIAHPMDAQACTRWLSTRLPNPTPVTPASTS